MLFEYYVNNHYVVLSTKKKNNSYFLPIIMNHVILICCATILCDSTHLAIQVYKMWIASLKGHLIWDIIWDWENIST